jgi:hypothetical protein
MMFVNVLDRPRPIWPAKLIVALVMISGCGARGVEQVPPTPTTNPAPSGPIGSQQPTPTNLPSWTVRNVAPGQSEALVLDQSAVDALVLPGTAGQGYDPARAMLVRLDRQSGTVRTAGPFPEASDLALAGGHLWVATGGPNASGKQQAVSLLRLDPTTLTVQQRVEMPALEVAGPVGPVIDGRGDALWMGAGQQLVRLDAGTGAPSIPPCSCSTLGRQGTSLAPRSLSGRRTPAVCSPPRRRSAATWEDLTSLPLRTVCGSRSPRGYTVGSSF